MMCLFCCHQSERIHIAALPLAVLQVLIGAHTVLVLTATPACHSCRENAHLHRVALPLALL
jgi:hypothetical protein